MSEIAKKIGVNQSTVSRALRNDPAISEKRRKQIQKAARKIGYQPNPMVSTLMAQLRSQHKKEERDVIAVINPWKKKNALKNSAVFSAFLKGAADHAKLMGYRLENFWLYETGTTPERLGKILFNRGIIGLLVAPPEIGTQLFNFPWHHFSCATIGHRLKTPLLNRAVPNHLQQMNLAMNHLLDLGYRRIGFVADGWLTQNIVEGWFGGLTYHWMRLPGECHIRPYTRNKPTSEEIKKWVIENEIDCLLSHQSRNYQLALESKLKIPQDIGFATLAADSTSNKDLTGVVQQFESVGKEAIELIVEAILKNRRGIPETPREIYVNAKWQAGKTTTQQNPSIPLSEFT